MTVTHLRVGLRGDWGVGAGGERGAGSRYVFRQGEGRVRMPSLGETGLSHYFKLYRVGSGVVFLVRGFFKRM